MIGYEEALKIVLENAGNRLIELVSCHEILGMVLAKDIRAPISLPPFSNSAVDGFAYCSSDKGLERVIQGTIAAETNSPALKKNHALQIMTGGMVPQGADSIIMQEQTQLSDGKIAFELGPKPGKHIRQEGEDILAGEIALQKGTRIEPQHICLAQALGVDKLEVIRKPTVSIVATGSELVPAGTDLDPGQVYYCTGPTLQAQAQTAGIDTIETQLVPDSFEATKAAIQKGLQADVLLVSGGMSVGKFDFVRPIFEELGVKKHFWKGAWRPGKPMYFGTFENRCAVFGIPGNPVAAFVMFELFVRPYLLKKMGKQATQTWKTGRLKNSTQKKPGFALFARARVDQQGNVEILPGQGSHQMSTLAKANAICWLDEKSEFLETQSEVRYLTI